MAQEIVSIEVPVEYKPEVGGIGYLDIADIFMTLKTESNVPSFTEASFVTVIGAGDEPAVDPLFLTSGPGGKLSVDRVELAGGVYDLNFNLKETGGVTYRETKTVLILPGRVTTVTGNLNEAVNSGFTFKVTIAKESFFSTGCDFFVNNDGSLQDAFNAARKYAGDEDPVIHLNSSMTLPETLVVAVETGLKDKVVLDLNSSELSVTGNVPVMNILDPAFTLEVIGAGNIKGNIAKAASATVNLPEGCLFGEIVTE